MTEEYIALVHTNRKRVVDSTVLDAEGKNKALFSLFSLVVEEATEVERILFTTLFSRIAYVGAKCSMSSTELHLLHRYRRGNERGIYEQGLEAFCALGVYCIDVIMHYGWGGESAELPDTMAEIFAMEDAKIVKFRPVISALMTAIDMEKSTINFVDEADGSAIETALFDISDKNEIFTDNLSSINRHIDLPVQVNLIDVEYMDDGSFVPQGLVLLPDYLVDVTAVADCFKDYGTESMLSVISRFRGTDPTSIPILIGNLANMFLDEIVADDDITFQSLMPKIFAYNPVTLSLYSDSDIRSIVEKAKIHFANLRQVVKQELPALGFSKENIFLEPSFFSRDYGLQGRLDLFHQDSKQQRLDIVELKSGKPFKANVYGLSHNHFIQTLLYDLLIKSTYGRGTKPSSYILYSVLSARCMKYAPAAKAQQYEAMKMRNELMILEYATAYSREKLRSLLEYIKPINFSKVKGFQLRDIEVFQKIFAGAKEYEKQYLTEYASFIKREQFLAKVGVHGLENSNGLAAIWLESSQEKEDRFAILRQLEIELNNTEAEVPTLTLRHSQFTSELANFRKGDIAVLYPYQDHPAAVMRNQVFKCNILERDKDTVTVKLRSKQYNHSLFKKYKYWNIEEDKLDSSFNKSYGSLFTFLAARADTRDLLLGIAEPKKYTPPVGLQLDENMTSEQQLLVSQMLGSKDYFLLWGPPGTGKTSVMIREYVKQVYEGTEQTILLLAYTNRAVDEICEAIMDIGPEYVERYVRVGSATASGDKFRSRVLGQFLGDATTRVQIRERLDQTRIFVGTVSSMINKPELFNLKSFDVVVIDEASQILEPTIIGLLTRVRKFIMIGDHNQLPAVVQQSKADSHVQGSDLRELGISDLSVSFFERLYRQCIAKGWTHGYGLLSQQGRMHPDLMAFPCSRFYEGKLTTLAGISRLEENTTWALANDGKWVPTNRLSYVPTSIEYGANYKTNHEEAAVVVELIRRYQKVYQAKGIPEALGQIGVITPYRAQIALIKNKCVDAGLDIGMVTVDTVERYQGGAREVIIFSLCVNRVGQFKSLVSMSTDGVDRKLNVALTRAKEHLVIVGAEQMMEKNEIYKDLKDCSHRWEVLVDA